MTAMPFTPDGKEFKLNMPRITGKTFTKQKVTLDGFRYEQCVFNECQLIYGGGPCRALSCYIEPNCTIDFQDHAAFVLQLLTDLGWKMTPPPAVDPSRIH
jgi:hypothetical protein